MNDDDLSNVSKTSKSSYSGQIKALREEKQRLLEKMKLPEVPEKNWSRPPVPLMGFGRGKPLNSKPQTLMDDNPTPLRRTKVVPTPVQLFRDEKNLKGNPMNFSLEKSFNLLDFIQTLPHTGAKFFKVDMTMKITKLGRPIGITLLPKSKKIVVGDTKSNQVKMFSHKGDFLKNIKNTKYINTFRRPSDMIAFSNDEFAIKDNVGIHLFDENGDFQKSFINPELGKLFGLATDGKNLLFTI